jgi:hypothetical protein
VALFSVAIDVEARPIVVNAHADARIVGPDVDSHVARVSVLAHVVQRLLDNA